MPRRGTPKTYKYPCVRECGRESTTQEGRCVPCYEAERDDAILLRDGCDRCGKKTKSTPRPSGLRYCRPCSIVINKVKRGWTKKLRQWRADLTRQHHREGRFNYNRPNKYAWTEQEDTILRKGNMAGHGVDILVEHLEKAKASPRVRTRTAVVGRMKKLGLSVASFHHTIKDVARMTGLAQEAIRLHINEGKLAAHNNGRSRPRHIERSAVEQFCREHYYYMTPSRVRDRGLRTIVEVAHRSDPILTTVQIAAYLGTSWWTVNRMVQDGILVPFRRKGSHAQFKRSQIVTLVKEQRGA